MQIGYLRTSEKTNKSLRQKKINQLEEIGCKKIFEDVGGYKQNYSLNTMINTLKPNDIIFMEDETRISREAQDITNFCNLLKNKKVTLKFLG